MKVLNKIILIGIVVMLSLLWGNALNLHHSSPSSGCNKAMADGIDCMGLTDEGMIASHIQDARAISSGIPGLGVLLLAIFFIVFSVITFLREIRQLLFFSVVLLKGYITERVFFHFQKLFSWTVKLRSIPLAWKPVYECA